MLLAAVAVAAYFLNARATVNKAPMVDLTLENYESIPNSVVVAFNEWKLKYNKRYGFPEAE